MSSVPIKTQDVRLLNEQLFDLPHICWSLPFEERDRHSVQKIDLEPVGPSSASTERRGPIWKRFYTNHTRSGNLNCHVYYPYGCPSLSPVQAHIDWSTWYSLRRKRTWLLGLRRRLKGSSLCKRYSRIGLVVYERSPKVSKSAKQFEGFGYFTTDFMLQSPASNHEWFSEREDSLTGKTRVTSICVQILPDPIGRICKETGHS